MRRAMQSVNHVQSALSIMMLREGVSEIKVSFEEFNNLGLEGMGMQMFLSDEEVEPDIPAYVIFKLVRKDLQ